MLFIVENMLANLLKLKGP